MDSMTVCDLYKISRSVQIKSGPSDASRDYHHSTCIDSTELEAFFEQVNKDYGTLAAIRLRINGEAVCERIDRTVILGFGKYEPRFAKL